MSIQNFNENEQKFIASEINSDCKRRVKAVLSKFICTNEDNLSELSNTSDEIIDEIFKNNEITIKVYDLKMNDAVLYEHSVMVAALSILTALMFNFSHDIIMAIGIGSFLHDLGLRKINVDYKNKSQDDLSIDELFEYKKHTIHGFATVENESWMPVLAKKIVLEHHENVDGTGYPFRQKIAMVPVKIVSVCDGFVDRICGVGYETMKVDEAISDMLNYVDTVYDRKVLDIFFSFLAKYPVGTKIKTQSGDIAEVIGQNEYYTDKPVIRLLEASDGRVYDSNVIVNLSDIRTLLIESTL